MTSELTEWWYSLPPIKKMDILNFWFEPIPKMTLTDIDDFWESLDTDTKWEIYVEEGK